MKDHEPRRIRLDDLLPTGHVDPSKVEGFRSGGKGADQPIEYVVGEDGQKYTIDGNHRYWGARQRGEEEIEACESDLPDSVKRNWLDKLLKG